MILEVLSNISLTDATEVVSSFLHEVSHTSLGVEIDYRPKYILFCEGIDSVVLANLLNQY
jgi:hypothetical protein